MEDIVIFAKKTKLAGMAIGCLVFEAFFIHFFINGLPEAQAPFKSFVPAASFIGAPLCSVVLIYICFRLLRPSPVVVINREGILDNASIFSAGLIPGGMLPMSAEEFLALVRQYREKLSES